MIMTHFHIFTRVSLHKQLCVVGHQTRKIHVKDLFIVQIRVFDVQQELIKAKTNLGNTLQLALQSEKGAKTSD